MWFESVRVTSTLVKKNINGVGTGCIRQKEVSLKGPFHGAAHPMGLTWCITYQIHKQLPLHLLVWDHFIQGDVFYRHQWGKSQQYEVELCTVPTSTDMLNIIPFGWSICFGENVVIVLREVQSFRRKCTFLEVVSPKVQWVEWDILPKMFQNDFVCYIRGKKNLGDIT